MYLRQCKLLIIHNKIISLDWLQKCSDNEKFSRFKVLILWQFNIANCWILGACGSHWPKIRSQTCFMAGQQVSTFPKVGPPWVDRILISNSLSGFCVSSYNRTTLIALLAVLIHERCIKSGRNFNEFKQNFGQFNTARLYLAFVCCLLYLPIMSMFCSIQTSRANSRSLRLPLFTVGSNLQRNLYLN